MSDNMLHIKAWHGGKFINEPRLHYEGGNTCTFDVDLDKMSYFELMDHFIDTGSFKTKADFEIQYMLPGHKNNFEDGLLLLEDDMHVKAMLEYIGGEDPSWTNGFTLNMYATPSRAKSSQAESSKAKSSQDELAREKENATKAAPKEKTNCEKNIITPRTSDLKEKTDEHAKEKENAKKAKTVCEKNIVTPKKASPKKKTDTLLVKEKKRKDLDSQDDFQAPSSKRHQRKPPV